MNNNCKWDQYAELNLSIEQEKFIDGIPLHLSFGYIGMLRVYGPDGNTTVYQTSPITPMVKAMLSERSLWDFLAIEVDFKAWLGRLMSASEGERREMLGTHHPLFG